MSKTPSPTDEPNPDRVPPTPEELSTDEEMAEKLNAKLAEVQCAAQLEEECGRESGISQAELEALRKEKPN